MRNNMKLTDEQLIAAYAAGDNTAFDTLLLRHKDRLFTYIYQLVRDSNHDCKAGTLPRYG